MCALPLVSNTCIPPSAAAPAELSTTILSPISNVVELTIVCVPFTVRLPGIVTLFPSNVEPSTKTAPLVEDTVKLPDAPVCVIVCAVALSKVIFPAIAATPLTSNVVVSVSPATVNCPLASVNKSESPLTPILFAANIQFSTATVLPFNVIAAEESIVIASLASISNVVESISIGLS